MRPSFPLKQLTELYQTPLLAVPVQKPNPLALGLSYLELLPFRRYFPLWHWTSLGTPIHTAEVYNNSTGNTETKWSEVYNNSNTEKNWSQCIVILRLKSLKHTEAEAKTRHW